MSDTPDTAPVRVHDDDDASTTIEVTVAAPVATVWEHLREPALIARWHGWDFEGLDAEIDLIYGAGAREGAEPHVLETKGGAAPGSFEHGDRFDLREEDGGTVVRVTRGPRGVDPDWDAMYDDITQGWVSFLAQLRFAVEQRPGWARRTVLLVDAPARVAARDLLGLAGLDAGSAWSARPTPDLDLAGTGWFRTSWQTGVTVDGYGPGLVVAADKPDPDGGFGASMVIVSTYGLEDERFAEVELAWQTWWKQHHAPAEDAGPTS